MRKIIIEITEQEDKAFISTEYDGQKYNIMEYNINKDDIGNCVADYVREFWESEV